MKSFAVAMKEFFGLLPNQKPMDFLRELKALDADDRTFFRVELERLGYQLTPEITPSV